MRRLSARVMAPRLCFSPELFSLGTRPRKLSKARWGPTELLAHLADEELRERSRRSLERRRTRSRRGRFKPDFPSGVFGVDWPRPHWGVRHRPHRPPHPPRRHHPP
jgi:hypothetical protein